jgi:ArsR family transcriptional regulator, arsenate/arsenite/antimonite-responsive transcriptional repressor
MSMNRTLPIMCCAPLAAPMLSDEEAEGTAALFRALGDPARVRIVNLLATSHEAVCVCNLVEPLGLSQPTVSHHLKKLVDAGLLDRERRGKWAYFSINPEAMARLAGLADLDTEAVARDADSQDVRALPARPSAPTGRDGGSSKQNGRELVA